MAREILHLTIPAFPIALARLDDTSLRGRPVAVAPGTSDRALLHCISEEAAAEGLTPGTPAYKARRVCPSLVVIPPDPLRVFRGSQALADLAGEFTPLVEPGAGRLYLDVSASRRLFGPARDVAAKLERSISKNLRLAARAGTAGNKLISRIAADVLPEPGVYDVFHGLERSFVAPFPISVLPGVGDSRQFLLLRDLNLQKVEEVAALSLPQLRLAVGTFAPLLHERACGIDRSPVQPPRRSTEIVEEAFLDEEENEDRILLAELFRLAEGCGLRLRQTGKNAEKITLTVTYADGVTEAGTRRLSSPVSLDAVLFVEVEILFRTVCRRRVRVRALRLACAEGAAGTRQMDLFSSSASHPKDAALQDALDEIRQRHGKDSLRWGRVIASAGEQPAASPDTTEWDGSRTRYMTLTRVAGR